MTQPLNAPKKITNELAKVGVLITEGIEKWIEAGNILCAFLDDGGSMEAAVDKTGLSSDILSRFEQIGRKQIHPRLLASTTPGMRALSLCTYNTQEKYIDSPVEVLIANSQDVLLVKIDNLTPYQCRQVFCRGHVATLPEQRAWIESEKTKTIDKKPETLPYSIVGRKITFRRGTVITVAEMKKILGAIK